MCSTKECIVCKLLKPTTTEFFRLDKIGFRNECKLCRNKRLRNKYNDPSTGVRERILLRNKDGTTVLNNYRSEDKRKGRTNDLTLEYIREEMKRPCTYCGFPATGLDRIDNSKGHIMGNCIPCCKECNVSRGDNFSVEEMLILGQTIRQIKSKRYE